VRAEAEDAGEPLGARIRRAKLEKVPYVLVVGDSDVAGRTVGVNARGSAEPERGVDLESFVEQLRVEAAPPIGRELGTNAAGAP
jgi:threonyl-tRNA synthetase